MLIALLILLPACTINSDDISNDISTNYPDINITNDDTSIENISEINVVELFDETVNGHANFRNVMWGMSVDEVLEAEELDYTYKYDSDNYLTYKFEIDSIEFELWYRFDNNQLVSVLMAHFGKLSSGVDYYGIYTKLVNEYTEIYEAPRTSNVNWRDDSYGNEEPKSWNEAIINGVVDLVDIWDTKYTGLMATVYGGDKNIDISIFAKKSDYIFPEYVAPVPPAIGMTAKEAENSTWGRPSKINRTTTVYGVHEQWVYYGNKYLYFDDGILTAIQD